MNIGRELNKTQALHLLSNGYPIWCEMACQFEGDRIMHKLQMINDTLRFWIGETPVEVATDSFNLLRESNKYYRCEV